MRSPEIPVPVYSVAELMQLSNSPLVLASLTSGQKQGIADVMAYIPPLQPRPKARPPSPTGSNRSSSPTTSASAKRAKKSPASETVSLPKVDTPPRRRTSKRRPASAANANANLDPDRDHPHHRRKQWGYASSFHHNEDNWRAHPSVAIAA